MELGYNLVVLGAHTDLITSIYVIMFWNELC